MFNDTIAKIREEVAELEQFDYTSDDLILASNITGRIRKWLKELEKEYNTLDQVYSNACDEKDRRIRFRDNELKAAKKELAQKDEKIEKLYHDLDDSDIEINNLREDNVALVERIEKLESENEGMAWTSLDNISDLKMKIKERDEFIENLKEENGSLKRLLDEYYKKLEDKNYLIDHVRYKNGKLEKFIDKLNCDMAQKDELIEKLNKELAIARVSSRTRMCMAYIDSKNRVRLIDNYFEAIDEAIKKLDEEN